MFKSSSQLLSVLLGVGLIGSNFFSLMILARKDSDALPNLANLPYTDNSSFSIRSDKTKDGHSWALKQNQHSPKTMLFTKDLKEEIPGFKGTKKRESYVHQESVAYSYRPLPSQEIKNEGLTAQEIACIEKGAQGRSNGEMVGTLGAAQVSPALSGVPVIGPVIAGIFFGQARKQAGKAGEAFAKDWNDC